MEHPNEKTDVDDNQFDRLVDGELLADEYRALLARLDDEPGGWRRCAMAFLEAQALEKELGGLRRSLNARGCTGEKEMHRAPASIAPSRIDSRMLLAVAASFLAAFALGILILRFLPIRGQDGLLVGNLPAKAGGLSSSGMSGDERSDLPTMRPVGNVQVLMDEPGGEATRTGQVPVYEVGQDLEQFLSADQPTLGPELIELLRQQGYDVQHQQQLFPAPLNDGRQIIVPVDGYRITPVSRRF